MNPRVLLSLMVTLVVTLAVAAVLALARPDADEGIAAGIVSATTPYAGATTPPAPAPPFRLPDQRGRETTIAQFRGQPLLVTFLYSHCEDTCPILARQIAGALDQVGRPMPVVIVSVDPGGDTAASAQRFLNRMRLGDRARFLLGSRTTLAPIWKAYGVQPQGSGFDHSAKVFLLDERGRQRVSFPVDQLTDDALAHDMRVLQAQRDRAAAAR
ncbi:SCO family protein [Patulibacter defluvii]|uniref:SCO family protein n=1 Tax=Patulibacter defluvii TaxID=3095358 RepID=UPI002A751DB4|nr:SCO family protein [Patulibacter sp. DM4]